MKNYMYEKLKNHIGHNIVCVAYGDDYHDPDDICIECEDCNEVLISAETYEEENEKENKLDFYISSINDGGSGTQYQTKEEFLKEVSLMVDDCIANGGSYFDISIEADASCYSQEEK